MTSKKDARPGDHPPGRAGRPLTAQRHCWLFLLISLILPEPMLPLPSMALSQFGFPFQGLISPNVTELTYKRETVLETFVIGLQHTKGLNFYSTKARASERFLLSSALVPCRAAQIHQSQTTHPCHQTQPPTHVGSPILHSCNLGNFDVKRLFPGASDIGGRG